MNDADRDIERVLAGLKAVEASEGLELRVLAAAQERAAERVRFVWLRPAGAFALASVAVMLGVAAMHRRGHAPVASAVSQVRPRAAAQVAGRQVHEASAAVRTHGKAAAVDPPVAAVPESLEVSEMLAPSMPPPPMPLTEQERLLLRVAHAGDPQEMAMLNPGMERALDAREQTERERMMRQPTAYAQGAELPKVESHALDEVSPAVVREPEPVPVPKQVQDAPAKVTQSQTESAPVEAVKVEPNKVEQPQVEQPRNGESK